MVGQIALFPMDKELPDNWRWLNGQILLIKNFPELWKERYFIYPNKGFEQLDSLHFKLSNMREMKETYPSEKFAICVYDKQES